MLDLFGTAIVAIEDCGCGGISWKVLVGTTTQNVVRDITNWPWFQDLLTAESHTINDCLKKDINICKIISEIYEEVEQVILVNGNHFDVYVLNFDGWVREVY